MYLSRYICCRDPVMLSFLSLQMQEEDTPKMKYRRSSHWRAKQHYCPKCQRGFTLKSNMNRHVKFECGFEPRYKCPYCCLRSKQTSQIYSHIRKKHPGHKVSVVNVENIE
ncbi:hypothetical protein TSAR_012270 [Trichomalopsis sarcophagae]|uniref:C2H2-type domain-containing protein n=1 Tax=Trichomalopsis sarcophagae TaxID=543379 RepID=A0A232FN31_9HYME|nr:hypothetical protein TSAR_012270 [Trichomalopsis sarcophagae]